MHNTHKLSFIALCLITTVFIRAQYVEYSQVEKLVHLYAEHLFYGNHDPAGVQRFTQQTTQKVSHNCAEYYFFGIHYNTQRIYNAVVSESVNFAADQAQQLTHNQQAADRIREELIKKIDRMGELPPGLFAQYTGAPFKQRLARLYPEKTPRPSQPQQTIAPPSQEKLYPSAECCCCLEEFDSSIQQVFLHPCGHDLCTTCYQRLFTNNTSACCPQCRQKINSCRAANIQPSAPPASEVFG